MSGDRSWRNVLAEIPMFEGKFQWALSIDYYPYETGIMVGVAALDMPVNVKPDLGKPFWGIYLYDGN